MNEYEYLEGNYIEEEHRHNKAKAVVISIFAIIFAIILAILGYLLYREILYRRSVNKLVKRDFETAYVNFTRLDKYKDSQIKKEYAYELFNYENGYLDYEVMTDYIVSSNGTVIIEYDTNGGAFIPNKVITEVVEGNYVTEQAEKVHYDFLNWSLSYAEYSKENDAVVFTITANYNIHNYPISYTLNGGSIASNAPTRYSYFGPDVSIPNPVKKGYTFTGYEINGDTSEKYVDLVIKHNSSGSYDLNATYDPILIHVYFDANGGTCDTSEADIQFDYPATLPSVTPPSHYTFDGWYYNDKPVDLEHFNVSEQNATLVAHYLPEQYSITYILNGGDMLGEAPTSYNYESNDLKIPFAHKDGYFFSGWVKDEETDGNINYTITQHSYGDLVLTAKYVKYITSTEDPTFVTNINGSEDQNVSGIVVPVGVNKIHQDVVGTRFQGLQFIEVEEGHSVFYANDNFLLYRNEEHERILALAPRARCSVNDVTIPECDVIGPRVFDGLWPIDHIITKSPLKRVEYRGFAGCIDLVDISNAALTEVGDEAFISCKKLHENILNTNPNLTKIGNSAFQNTEFPHIRILSNVVKVGDYAFANTKPALIVLDYSPTAEISNTVFSGVSNVVNLRCRLPYLNRALELLSSSISSIQNIYVMGGGELSSDALQGQQYFMTITFENTNFNAIYANTFKDTTNFFKTTIPGSVELIGESAFENSHISFLDFGNVSNLKRIGKNAFKNSDLRSIDLSNANDLIIEEGAFENCSLLESVKINYNSASYLNAAFQGCGLLTNIEIDYTDGALSTGIIFKESYFEDLNAVTEFKFVNKTEESIKVNFGSKCFRNCEELVDIKLENLEVGAIDSYVFENCRSFLNSYHYFDNLEVYPTGAFFGCESVDVQLDYTVEIGDFAFVSCHSLGGASKTVYLGYELERIGTEAFAYTAVDLTIETNRTKDQVDALSYDASSPWYKWNMNFFGTIVYQTI